MSLDAIDRRLLAALQDNGRLSATELAGKHSSALPITDA